MLMMMMMMLLLLLLLLMLSEQLLQQHHHHSTIIRTSALHWCGAPATRRRWGHLPCSLLEEALKPSHSRHLEPSAPAPCQPNCLSCTRRTTPDRLLACAGRDEVFEGGQPAFVPSVNQSISQGEAATLWIRGGRCRHSVRFSAHLP
ncbi:unnamed protein product [Periconia digitata]|uniref:Secreted protein n=1 Tax=Periconia digitata TaxID=1303443 RepID=A0A9W4ULB2_9PLEO|nr:unnamed protein product [Periconia digitata]